MAKLSSTPDNRNDWLPPGWAGKKLPPGVPVDSLYSPSRRQWRSPSTGEVVSELKQRWEDNNG